MWTNSCCGHPLPGESREDAVKRRLKYELGMTVRDLQLVIPKYIYKTPPYNGIIEHEFCPIYVGVASSDITMNHEEVADYKWVDWNWYVEQLQKDNDYSDPTYKDAPKWSWWCKDQLEKLSSSKKFLKYFDNL